MVNRLNVHVIRVCWCVSESVMALTSLKDVRIVCVFCVCVCCSLLLLFNGMRLKSHSAELCEGEKNPIGIKCWNVPDVTEQQHPL